MIELIPSILVESHQEFERRLRLVDQKVKTVHVDILDGSIYPHLSWHDPQIVGDIVTPVEYEIHLMVENPLPIIREWKKHVPNLKRAIIQAELDRPVGLVLEEIKQTLHLEAWSALSPETPVKDSITREANLDGVMVMGVHPGASGQPILLDLTISKIHQLRGDFPTLPIACDGGVTAENAETLVKAGCTKLIASSAIFSAENPAEALDQLLHRFSAL